MGYIKNKKNINNKHVMFKWLPQDPNDMGYFLHVAGDALDNNVVKLTAGPCSFNSQYSVNICNFQQIELELHSPTMDEDFDKYLEAGGILPRILISEPALINMDQVYQSDSLKTKSGRDSAVSVIDAIDFPFRFGTYTLRTLTDGPCVNPWARNTDNSAANNESPECKMRRNILAGYDYTPPAGLHADNQGGNAAAYCEYCHTDSCCCQRLNDYQGSTTCMFIYNDLISVNSCQSSVDNCSSCSTEECCAFLSQSVNPLMCYMKTGNVCTQAPDACSDCGDDNACCDAKIGECYFQDTCKKLPLSCADISVETDCTFMKQELGCAWEGNSCISDVANCQDCNALMNPFGCCTSTSDALTCNFYKNVCLGAPTTCDDCNIADAEYTAKCCEFSGSSCGVFDGVCKALPGSCHECMHQTEPKNCCIAAWDSMWCQWMNEDCIADMSKQCTECNYSLNPQGCCKSRDYCHYYLETKTPAGSQPLGVCERQIQSCEQCNISPFVNECCSLIDGCSLTGFACHVDGYLSPDICVHGGAVYAGVGFAAGSVGLIVVLTIMTIHWLTYDTKIKGKDYMESVPDPTLNKDFYYADAELKPLPLNEDERTALLEATDAGTTGGITSSSCLYDKTSS